jgi:hypothetical protein
VGCFLAVQLIPVPTTKTTMKKEINKWIALYQILQYFAKFKNHKEARCQWLTHVILATQETEIRKITV